MRIRYNFHLFPNRNQFNSLRKRKIFVLQLVKMSQLQLKRIIPIGITAGTNTSTGRKVADVEHHILLRAIVNSTYSNEVMRYE